MAATKTVKSDMPRIMYFMPTWPLAFMPSAPSSVMNSVVRPASTDRANMGSGTARFGNHSAPPVSASEARGEGVRTAGTVSQSLRMPMKQDMITGSWMREPSMGAMGETPARL